MNRQIGWVFAAALALGCGGSEKAEAKEKVEAGARSKALVGDPDQRCDAKAADHETSEYDTSGDDIPDVRKVFLRVGGATGRLVLVCREADLNADGSKDVVRYYTNEGRPLREETDRDFDGKMDEITHYEDGRIALVEADQSNNGVIDVKVYYENGRPLRAERDTAGRSTSTEWRPNIWEYYEKGRVIRMGTDIDGDGSVDRWDRDEALKARMDAEAIREASSGEEPDTTTEPDSSEDTEAENEG